MRRPPERTPGKLCDFVVSFFGLLYADVHENRTLGRERTKTAARKERKMPRERTTTLSQPVFDEARVTADPTKFKIFHDPVRDNQLFKEFGDLMLKDVVPFEKMRGAPGDLFTLQSAFGSKGAAVDAEIRQAGQLTFHAGGDTGASTDTKGKYRDEITVADQMSNDCHTSAPATRPRFFYHLGDVVYNFGESQFWFDQFYEPFRNYPGPIFAIPGNHDSFVVPGVTSPNTPLETFMRNFCAQQPMLTAEAASLHRTAMTQPGVYFTLDAPFVRVIGLFSNALEDPGVISSTSPLGAAVPDFQLEYLQAQLARIKSEKYQGAVLLTVHHPPFSFSTKDHGAGASGNHGSSIEMLGEIDTICKQEGVYPHAVLSGHAHNYQRYTRSIHVGANDYEVPFVVCGDSGHNVNPIVRSFGGHAVAEPSFDTDVSYLDEHPVFDGPATRRLVLKKYADSKTSYGYLRITMDTRVLRIGFHLVGVTSPAQSRFDQVTVDLKTHRLVSN